MHVMLAWDITASGARWEELNKSLRDCLKQYSWVRVLRTVYVVRLMSEQAWSELVSDLTKVASAAPETVHFIVTPLMSAGAYNGYLPEQSWQKINERSAP